MIHPTTGHRHLDDLLTRLEIVVALARRIGALPCGSCRCVTNLGEMTRFGGVCGACAADREGPA